MLIETAPLLLSRDHRERSLERNHPVVELAQVGRHDADELARRDHLGLCQELRKIQLIARHQIVGARGFSAFQELVIVGVSGHAEPAAREPIPILCQVGR